MTKNTAYYKAAFAKSEAASPYAKMNPHMKKDKTHMMAHHGDTSMKMSHDSAMETHDPTHMKMEHRKEEKTNMKKYGTHTKMAGKSHMKGTMEQHRAHHKAEHGKGNLKQKPGTYIGPGDFKMMKYAGDTD